MPFKDLEHDGEEEFDKFSVRQDVKKEKREKKLEKKLTEHEDKEKRQKEWLSPENPFLWDGEFE